MASQIELKKIKVVMLDATSVRTDARVTQPLDSHTRCSPDTTVMVDRTVNTFRGINVKSSSYPSLRFAIEGHASCCFEAVPRVKT
jgi:hypothetical protein